MTSTAKKILEEALSLTEDERRDLAERLLDTVPYAGVVEPGAWTLEALRRANELESGTGELLDLDEALLELRTNLQRQRQP